jgi:hypothetical protein
VKALNSHTNTINARKRAKAIASAFTLLNELPAHLDRTQWLDQQESERIIDMEGAAMARWNSGVAGRRVYSVPRNNSLGQHELFDYLYWSRLIQDHNMRRGCIVSGPGDLCSIERSRELVFREYDFGLAVPVDLFLWKAGTPPKPYLTKCGGIPHRPKDEPWPVGRDGGQLTFVAQICFLDSMSIIPLSLPGDVMLVFLRDKDSFSRQADVHVEWWPAAIADVMNAEDLPEPSFHVPCLTGLLHRTYDFPEAESIFEYAGFDAAPLIATTQGTKIGTETFYIQGRPFTSNDTLICTLSSFLPSPPWPFFEASAPSTDDRLDQTFHDQVGDSWPTHSLVFGDRGCIYFFQDASGATKLCGDCY